MKKQFAFLSLWLLALTCFCVQPVWSAEWKERRENLDQVYLQGEFRIFYTFKGEDALPVESRVDRNKNRVPDLVEDIARQLTVTSDTLVNSLGFRHPLNNWRYKGKAHSIDIHFMKREKKGGAGDRVIVYRYKNRKVKRQPSVSIALKNTLTNESITPAHELFHVFMNGYTMFKNRWATEGLARWSEFLLRKDVGKQKPLPGTRKELEKVLGQTYKTKYLWNRLAFLCEKGSGEIKDYDMKLTYVGGGEPIVQDNLLDGFGFVSEYLDSLGKADKIAARDFGYGKKEWKEKDQKSERNNIYILCALKKTLVAQQCREKEPEEMDQFFRVIDGFSQGRCGEVLFRVR